MYPSDMRHLFRGAIRWWLNGVGWGESGGGGVELANARVQYFFVERLSEGAFIEGRHITVVGLAVVSGCNTFSLSICPVTICPGKHLSSKHLFGETFLSKEAFVPGNFFVQESICSGEHLSVEAAVLVEEGWVGRGDLSGEAFVRGRICPVSICPREHLSSKQWSGETRKSTQARLSAQMNVKKLKSPSSIRLCVWGWGGWGGGCVDPFVDGCV